MMEQIAFQRTKENVSPELTSSDQPLAELVPDLIGKFVPQFNAAFGDKKDIRESEVVGALAGFLASVAPQIHTQIDVQLVPDSSARADLVLQRGSERLLIEVKRFGPTGRMLPTDGVQQVSKYMILSGITNAILFRFSFPNKGTIIQQDELALGTEGRISILLTEK